MSTSGHLAKLARTQEGPESDAVLFKRGGADMRSLADQRNPNLGPGRDSRTVRFLSPTVKGTLRQLRRSTALGSATTTDTPL